METTQVVPTILELLGLPPSSLQAVQREGTQVLPGHGNDNDNDDNDHDHDHDHGNGNGNGNGD